MAQFLLVQQGCKDSFLTEGFDCSTKLAECPELRRMVSKGFAWASQRGEARSAEKSLALADAAREPFIAYSREEFPDYHRRLNAVFAKVKVKSRIIEEHDGFSGIIPAVEARRGVALASESFAYSAGNRVRLLRLTPEPKPSIIGIAAPAGPLSPAAEKFWQCAEQTALAIS
ncbi:MAG TPA: LysR substrate-binding domain-containing protein [Chthoniobacterales bacterium]|nr:LysR substrate-binding domain-containing protein [Chthoniobacterales bacterium]